MRDENIICSCAVRFPWLGRAKDEPLGMDGWMNGMPKPLGIGLIPCELTRGSIPGKELILHALRFWREMGICQVGASIRCIWTNHKRPENLKSTYVLTERTTLSKQNRGSKGKYKHTRQFGYGPTKCSDNFVSNLPPPRAWSQWSLAMFEFENSLVPPGPGHCKVPDCRDRSTNKNQQFGTLPCFDKAQNRKSYLDGLRLG